MIIYGASGHAKVVEDVVESSGGSVSYFVDDNPALSEVHGIKVVHHFLPTKEPVIIAIGNNAVRSKIASSIDASFGTAIHPSAVLSGRATIGEGTVVMAGAIIQTDTTVGRHCIVNTGASVDHECLVGDFVHISPHATLCGNVVVGEGTWIGAGATVIQGIKIGKWSVIGAGSVIVSDVPDCSLVVGNRAFTIKKRWKEGIRG